MTNTAGKTSQGYMPVSATCEWSTPQDLFGRLDAIYHFDLDPCASDGNHKCARYYTQAENGLLQPWAPAVVFMNPPYGRALREWMLKAEQEAAKGAVVVCLVPARTDTRWMQRAFRTAKTIVFMPGRLKFGNSDTSAPFPTCLVVFGSGDVHDLSEFEAIYQRLELLAA